MNFSPLDLQAAPVLAPRTLQAWGRTLAVAPHPDDEALGCGGTLASLAALRVPVAVMWVSDGAASHPGSKVYAPPKLANLREAEAKMALQHLGVGRQNSFFLRLPDGRVPFPGDEGFEAACLVARAVLIDFAPQTLLLPWRRDPHRDHRASWQLLAHAAEELEIQVFEYLVWAFERAQSEDWPQDSEASAFAVDISGVRAQKTAAIQAHVSQTTRLIKDDPGGFWLSPEVIAHFESDHETWLAPFYCRPDAAGRLKARDGEQAASGAASGAISPGE